MTLETVILCDQCRTHTLYRLATQGWYCSHCGIRPEPTDAQIYDRRHHESEL